MDLYWYGSCQIESTQMQTNLQWASVNERQGNAYTGKNPHIRHWHQDGLAVLQAQHTWRIPTWRTRFIDEEVKGNWIQGIFCVNCWWTTKVMHGLRVYQRLMQQTRIQGRTWNIKTPCNRFAFWSLLSKSAWTCTCFMYGLVYPRHVTSKVETVTLNRKFPYMPPWQFIPCRVIRFVHVIFHA